MTISWPSVKSLVHAVDVFSTRSLWSRRMNCWCALRIRPPGSRCASTSIWKPLQMPRIGMPSAAASFTSAMIGASAAIAPARR